MEDYSGRLRKEDWEVRPISLYTARRMVEAYHYAKAGSNTAVYTHGLFKAGSDCDFDCFGIAWWLPPTKSCGLATFPEDAQAVLSLSRLVIHPDAPKNACTFLLARSIKMIDRKKWRCLVTYADDWRGHTGTIYRASGWKYEGKTKPSACYTLRGRMIARKAGPRTRTHAEMLRRGCVFEGMHSKHKFTLVN